MSEKSSDKKLTFGRRTWNREDYTEEKFNELNQEEDNKNLTSKNISTQITYPMNLDQRIQRQYNLTANKHKKQKTLLHKKSGNPEDKSNNNDDLSFQCYVCEYKFNNDLKLIEHWNTEFHIKKLMAKEEIKFPVNYEEKYDKKNFILKQHLKYIQDTCFKPN